MALLADRVKETTTTTGTGTVSLAGAPAGFQSFNTAFVNGSLVYYVIQGGAEWEIGIGTTGTGTLARTQVLQSSNADALVPFSAGVKDVFCSYVADRAVTTVDAATLTNKTLDDYTNNIGANSTHFRIKATGTISKGSVVKATGYNPGEMAIEVAVVTSATDLVLGISEQALTAGQFGMAVVIGELFDVNTNGFTVGNIIYSNGAGGFTETKPASGLYQALGWVVRANTSNGVIAVNVVAPLYVETATNTANTSVLRDGSGNFSAGTITATLNGAAPAGSLSGTTLASGVTASSLTSVGTLSSLTVSGGATLATSSGNVNVGAAVTSTTWGKFVGVQAPYPGVVLESTATSGRKFSLGVDATQWYLRDETASATRFVVDASGNLAVDTDTLYVDAAANSVGIGTTTLKTYSGFNSLTLGNSSNNGGVLAFRSSYNSGDGAEIYQNTSGTLLFNTNSSTTALTISAAGNLAVDTNTLYVDAANNNVGIGTASPTTVLQSSFSSSSTGLAIVGGIPTLALYDSSGTTGTGVIAQFNADLWIFNKEAGSLLLGTSNVERARIDASGNLGLGVTPSAWNGTYKAFQNGQSSFMSRTTGDDLYINANAVFDSGGWKYINSAYSARYEMSSGVHKWFTAPSGTAGNAITFVQAMTLDASGRLGIGTTTPVGGLDVRSSGYIGSDANNSLFIDSTSSLVTIGAAGRSSFSTSALRFLTSDGTAALERARIDASGNLGLGVTPSAWASGRVALQIGGTPYIVGPNLEIGSNFYVDSGGYKYATTDVASRFDQNAGFHRWFTAPSGTAGNAITFTQAMTLDASGNLGVGATSPSVNGIDIVKAGGTATYVRTSDGTYAMLSGVSPSLGVGLVGTTSNHPVAFYANNAERARITSVGSFVIGTAALATTATDGFLYVPTCAGTPTGTPTTQTGTAPIVVDTTNHKLYFYSGGSWRDAGP